MYLNVEFKNINFFPKSLFGFNKVLIMIKEFNKT